MRTAPAALIAVMTLAGSAWGGEAPPEDPTVADAERFYDGLADGTKRSVYDQVAGACDPQRDGHLDHPMDPPKRFGALRLYPRGYRMARRVTALPLADQQRIYAYVFDHQVRSGWVKPAAPEGPAVTGVPQATTRTSP
jgi:hypothetical protein